MRKFLLVLLGFLCPVVAYSQQPISGMPPFGSFQTSGFDTVDRYNMNANFTIPIVGSAGRGVPFNFAVVYDSSVWTRYNVSYWTTNIGGGWKTNVPAGLVTYSTATGQCDTPPPYHNYTRYFNFRYTDAAGTTHPIALSYYGTNVCGLTPVPPRSGYASDASGYYAYASTAQNITITAKSGTVGTPQIIDTNGNIVSSTVNGSETDWTDSAGHVMLKVITSSTQIQYEYLDTSGTYQIATLKLQPYNVKTNFACSGITEYTGTQSLPYELDLADGEKYTFSYEATPSNTGYVTGRVQTVTLPTGGYYEYVYGTTNDGIYCSDGSTVSMNQVVNDGTNSNTWQYSRALVSGNQVTTVTDPASNAATYTFNTSAQETAENHYQGSASGTLLRTVNMTWASNGTPATAITVLEDNSTQSEVETSYDNYGNLLTLKEHDWGTGAPGSILRTTTNTYLSTSPYITANILDRPTLTTIADSTGTVKSRTVISYDDSGYINTPCITGAAQHDDSGHGCSYTVRGDPTTVTRYTDANTPAGPIIKHNTFDSLGNVVGADVDSFRHEQFNYSATTQYAHPDSTVIGLAPNQFTTTYTYSGYNGLMATSKDPNNQPTTYAYDNMLRPSSVTYPDTGLTSYSYSNPQYGGTYDQITEKMNASNNRVSYIWSDGIGRQRRVAVTNGETQPYDETQNTCFNSIGLVSLQGYPFQDAGWSSPISCSVAGDSYIYDALGRPKTITHTDGSSGSISYTTKCATATDEQGKSRKVCTDGLGRMTSVAEDPNGLNYTTTYAYDPLNNITSVVQGSETRSFVYDGLSRLTSATNPESGATSYTYDAYSHVATRTDARSIITTYSYDAAERLTSKTYSDGTPGAYFYYDQSSWAGINLSNGIGRLTSQGVFNGSNWLASSGFSYDALGRAINNPQWTATLNTTLQVPYTYDLIGDMTTYGNGGTNWLIFTQSFNVGGRVTQLTSNWVDSQHPGTLVSGAHYNGAGGITSYVLGNNLTGTAAYNGVVQPCRLNVNSSGGTLGSCTAAVPSGSLVDSTIGFNYGAGDNGNLMSWSAGGAQNFNRSYTYDGVNRLATMSSAGTTCTGLSWSYDQWGNRTAQNVTGGTCGTSQLGYNSYNHITNSGFQYDAAGNMTHDASHSYTYDAENHITKVDGGSTATYGYDVDGRRASKVVSGVETDYFYDLAGHPITEYGSGCGVTCWARGHVYLNGQIVAEYGNSTTYFVAADHLGSTRLFTNLSGGVVDSMDYLPFGEQIAGASSTTHKFTGYERDPESGLDNAQARYNSSSLGRFMSPDPVGNFVADATNPQTWNMYAYVNNDPTGMVDPLGLDTIDPNPPKRGPIHTPGLIYWEPIYTETCEDNGPGAPFWVNVGEGFSQPTTTLTCQINGFWLGRDIGPRAPGLLSRIVGKVCSAIPQGQVLSTGGALGALGAVGGSANLVTNYNTGQTTFSFSGSLGGGWNGAASGSVSAGYIVSSSQFSNSDYSGQFSTASLYSRPGPGGYISRGNGVTVAGLGMGASLIPSPTFGGSASQTGPQLGNNLLSALLLGTNPSALTNTIARMACNAHQ